MTSLQISFRAVLFGAAALAALTFAAPAVRANGSDDPPKTYPYTLTVLGAPGSLYSYGYGVNNKGQVVGDVTTSTGSRHAFLSDPNGGAMHDLGTLGGANSHGAAVNDAGQATGDAITTTRNDHAFFYDANNGGMRDLGTLGGSDSYGSAINASGQVAGTFVVTSGRYYYHAFLSAANGGALRDIGAQGNTGMYSNGYAVNASGQVAGTITTVSEVSYAFLTDANGMTVHNEGTLTGTNAPETNGSLGAAVNSRGQVVGTSVSIYNYSHAFISESRGTPLRDLGSLAATNSGALAINDADQVVGYSASLVGANHAFLFSNGKLTDLNTHIDPASGFTMESATGISNNGFITGYGVTANGDMRPFLLTPTTSASGNGQFGARLTGKAALGKATLR